MIELIDVTAKQNGLAAEMNNFSLLLREGEVRQFDRAFGELLINVILGFCHRSRGLVCFDGTPLSEHSVSFLRKMMAYIPSVDMFEKVEDKERKQVKMLAAALQSDANIYLAVEPFQYLSAANVAEAMEAFYAKAAQRSIVIIATDTQLPHRQIDL